MIVGWIVRIWWDLHRFVDKLIVFSLHLWGECANNFGAWQGIKFIGRVIPKANEAFVVQIDLNRLILLLSHFWSYKYYFTWMLIWFIQFDFQNTKKHPLRVKQPLQSLKSHFVSSQYWNYNFIPLSFESNFIYLSLKSRFQSAFSITLYTLEPSPTFLSTLLNFFKQNRSLPSLNRLIKFGKHRVVRIIDSKNIWTWKKWLVQALQLFLALAALNFLLPLFL